MEYKIGMKVKGKVTGIQPYGAFVSLDKYTQGLIHISELQHGYVKDIEEVIQVGDEVDVVVLDLDEYTKKISLSIRCLEPLTIDEQGNSKRYRYGKKGSKGFQSLADAMPRWTDKALGEIVNQRRK
ncbi:CvfD/Ygs/GSP13 family RNA-binding post-transcriptional regulator [Lacticigenium naphthae]|uniref:CvfD/Ygs/GSP13 family RNA-binding post-transcriptional regulator n=1 Tax=Lacticigenium naphthae TaxID=515351 RepID=UPI000414A079|nr:CvfD/Ygs/GSP13 family RNA-binding post-transcriptional regulator [Lacticigenium naphthae]